MEEAQLPGGGGSVEAEREHFRCRATNRNVAIPYLRKATPNVPSRFCAQGRRLGECVVQSAGLQSKMYSTLLRRYSVRILR